MGGQKAGDSYLDTQTPTFESPTGAELIGAEPIPENQAKPIRLKYGQQFGDWKICEKLDEGGFGQVIFWVWFPFGCFIKLGRLFRFSKLNTSRFRNFMLLSKLNQRILKADPR